MQIKINVFDSIFCRNGKPFAMSGDNVAQTVFPPPPSTFYGMLRSIYFAENPKDLVLANTEKDPTANLRIKGIYLLGKERKDKSSEVYMPLPADCVRIKDNDKAADEEKGRVLILDLTENNKEEIVSSFPFSHRLDKNGGRVVEGISEGLLDKYDFEEYLQHKSRPLPFKTLSDFVTTESKTGIARDYTSHTAREGCLYTVEMKRMATYAREMFFAVDFEGLNLPEKGFSRLGGEGRLMAYNVLTKPVVMPKVKTEGKYFKLYLATTTVFKKGYLPEWLDENTFEGSYKGCRVRLVAASLGKFCHVGGWDMKAGRAKNMYRGVPSGSVYVFENLSGEQNKPLEVFHGQAVNDYPEYDKQGFGLCFVGKEG